MKKVITLFSIELLKLKNQRFPIFSLLFIIIFTIVVALFRTKLSSVEIFNMGKATGWQILSFAASWALQIASLLILILSINIVADEFSDRTIKNILTRQVSRFQFLFGKIVTIGFIVLVFLSAIFIVGALMGAIKGSMGNLEERGYIISTWTSLLSNHFLAFIFSFITIFTLGIFGAFIAMLIPKPGVAIGLTICLYFIFNIISQFANVRNFLFTSFTYFPINTAKEISHGLASSWAPRIYWCLLTNLGTGIIFLFLAKYILKRKDILA